MQKKGLLAGALLSVAAILSVHALAWFVQRSDSSSQARQNDLGKRADLPPDSPDEQAAAQAAPSTQGLALPELEKRIGHAIQLVQPAVVAVKNPESAALPRSGRHERSGSGVIITADGLVLSQAHVSHVFGHDTHGNLIPKHQP